MKDTILIKINTLIQQIFLVKTLEQLFSFNPCSGGSNKQA